MAGAETEQAQKGRAGATAGGYCRLLEGRQFFFFFSNYFGCVESSLPHAGFLQLW